MISRSEDETIKIAQDFSKKLSPGAVIALEGDLGAGKTTFVKGIALGLGLESTDEVTSPTFALMNIYASKTPLYHFDLYRLDSAKDIESIGFEEFIDDSKAIKCVEWAEKGKEFLKDQKVYKVQLETAGEGERNITLPEIK